MYLYKSYCYPDLNAVRSTVQSQHQIDGFGLIQTVDVISSDTLAITYLQPDTSVLTVNYQAPTCQQPGFDNSYTGLTVEDATELSGLIILVLVIAYGIKLLRRAI
ncbi:MAG: hypothetical protein Q7U57_07335 [Methylovulum sp.]|nr:hypothetical protein [Methylovulum sp.]